MNKQKFNEEIEPPYSLKSTQEWFADIITNRLGENDTIYPYSPHGELVAEEAARYIVPSPTLRPYLRMQIYNQQYWWRLLKTLHANFPLVTRLFGTHAFNEEIGIPFLLKYPPNHWSLTNLGERLPKWLLENYREPDQSLVYNASTLDWAFIASFTAPQFPPLNLSDLIKDNPENLMNLTFYLQPHIHLFKWEYDLLAFRECFLKEDVDYWVDNRFPDLSKGKTFSFFLYRNHKNNIAWREISQGELALLDCFKKGTTMASACEFIENQDSSIYEEVETHMEKWLQSWTQAGLLTLTQGLCIRACEKV